MKTKQSKIYQKGICRNPSAYPRSDVAIGAIVAHPNTYSSLGLLLSPTVAQTAEDATCCSRRCRMKTAVNPVAKSTPAVWAEMDGERHFPKHLLANPTWDGSNCRRLWRLEIDVPCNLHVISLVLIPPIHQLNPVHNNPSRFCE